MHAFLLERIQQAQYQIQLALPVMLEEALFQALVAFAERGGMIEFILEKEMQQTALLDTRWLALAQRACSLSIHPGLSSFWCILDYDEAFTGPLAWGGVKQDRWAYELMVHWTETKQVQQSWHRFQALQGEALLFQESNWRRPSFSFQAGQAQISAGDQATLYWTLPPQTNGLISPEIGEVPSRGRQTVFPQGKGLYQLQFQWQGRWYKHWVRIPSVSPPKVLFGANRVQILPGQKVQLYWQVEEAEQVWLSSFGKVDKTGSLLLSLEQSQTFELTAKGFRKTEKRTVHIELVAELYPLELPDIVTLQEPELFPLRLAQGLSSNQP